jgi:hypothetical protein
MRYSPIEIRCEPENRRLFAVIFATAENCLSGSEILGNRLTGFCYGPVDVAEYRRTDVAPSTDMVTVTRATSAGITLSQTLSWTDKRKSAVQG